MAFITNYLFIVIIAPFLLMVLIWANSAGSGVVVVDSLMGMGTESWFVIP